MSEDLRIRDLSGSDGDAVRQLILSGLEEHWGELDEDLNRDLDDLPNSYPGGRTIVVEKANGTILGTGTVVPRGTGSAEVVRMAVTASSRRMGIGRLVLEELLGTARSWGASHVVLETTSTWTDVTAFYRSCGFRVSHESESAFGLDTWFEYRL